MCLCLSVLYIYIYTYICVCVFVCVCVCVCVYEAGLTVHELKVFYDDVISAAADFFMNKSEVQQHWRKKCMDHKRDYVEK